MGINTGVEESNRHEDELKEKVRNTIREWPNWKKREYNNNFAVSKFACKLDISDQRE